MKSTPSASRGFVYRSLSALSSIGMIFWAALFLFHVFILGLHAVNPEKFELLPNKMLPTTVAAFAACYLVRLVLTPRRYPNEKHTFDK